jgi:uncharacterized protein YggU (UPF0235/DUF167 family)
VLPRLYAIVDAAAAGRYGWTVPALARACLHGGARLLQVRAKQSGSAAFLAMVEEVRADARACGALLIVNDRADIAALASADGVHVGQEDLRVAESLLADEKERAEHVMLVDLGRNDVGRVARFGSVEVSELMAIETYSHVMHIVSSVIGRLNDESGAMDALRACLPAGTLSGAPKIRAMEIIDELEPVKRGIYGGAIGYLSYSGDLDTCIHIRTVVVKDGVAHIRVAAPPVEGAANQALIAYLSDVLGVPKSALGVRSGQGSREKSIDLGSADAAQALQALAALAGRRKGR